MILLVILHFITRFNKSSWLYRLHNKMNEYKDIKSYVVCLYNSTETSNVYELSKKYKIKSKLIKYIDRFLFLSKKNIPFSSGLFGINTLKDKRVIRLIKSSDVINIHWINQGLLSIKDIVKLSSLDNKQVFWRFYDSWPFTGGCHVRMKCENFVDGCGNCPNLKIKRKNDITKLIFNYKKNKLSNKNFKIIAPSSYLEKQIKKSPLFSQSKIFVINNGIEKTYNFDRDKLIKKYQLDKTKKYILFGATDTSLIYKGYEYLKKSLDQMNYDFKRNVILLTFGRFTKNLISDYKIINFGFINDRSKLLELFAIADVFVGPSLEESFGNVFLESLSVGTPCVLFDELGASYDLIEHKKHGYIVKPLDIEDLSKGIVWTLDNSESLRENCINRINEKFLLGNITKKYLDLYNDG